MKSIQELKNLRNWIQWGKNGRDDKQPYSHRGYRTGTTIDHADEWGTYDDIDGRPGFVFTGTKIAGLDIDAVGLEDGELVCLKDKDHVCDLDAAEALMNDLNGSSYWERSPSGTGSHMLFITEDEWAHKGEHVEVYTDRRYFTVTEDELPASAGVIKHIELARLRGVIEAHSPSYDGDFEIEIPDEPPESMPLCALKLASTRSDQRARKQYRAANGPFSVDTHLGQVLIANGYSIEEATEVFADYPKNGDPSDFDINITHEHLERLYRKQLSGDLTPPRSAIENAGLDISSCDCAIHGDRGYEQGDADTAMPLPRPAKEALRRDKATLTRARNQVRALLDAPVEESFVYHAPQGLGKTWESSRGARHEPRMIITTNKGEHRDTVKEAARREGITFHEIVPFGDSWLASSASPVQEEVNELYSKGVMPKYITAEYGDIVPDDAETPYMDQFDGDPPDEDLVIGSPGHENVLKFRSAPGDTDELVARSIIHDDTHPASHDINQTMFRIDDARAGLNELLQEIDELESNSITELLNNRDDRMRVEKLAISTGGGEQEEEAEDEVDDVWSALEAAASEPDAIVVDLVDIVRRRENVRGDTIVQLKVLTGAEVRGVDAFSWEDNGEEWYAWVAHPDLREHEVAILSATPVPHVASKWIDRTGAGPVSHKSVDEDWMDIRRAQGYLLVKTSNARNSRSGGGTYAKNPAERKKRMQEKREQLLDAIEAREGERPVPIDAKKLLGDGEGVNFARTWSNNELRNEDVGFVAGATYYGDEWVKAHGAYVGRHIDVVHEPGKPAWSRDAVGQDLIDFMVRAPVEQAATRYGRSTDNLTVVYVDTTEIPADFPAVDAADHILRLTDTHMAVHEAVMNGSRTVQEIADHVDVTARQVNNVVWELDDMGLLKRLKNRLSRGQDSISGNERIEINKIILPEIPRADRGQSGSESHRENMRRPDAPSGAQTTLRLGMRASDDAKAVPGAESDGPPPDTRQTKLL